MLKFKSLAGTAAKTLECVNLRPVSSDNCAGTFGAVVPDGDMLEPVGAPQVLSNIPIRPLIEWNDSAGRSHLLGAHGLRLVAIDDIARPEPRYIGDVAAEPVCAVSEGESSIVVMTSAGPVVVMVDSSVSPIRYAVTDKSQLPPFPAIRLFAADVTTRQVMTRPVDIIRPSSSDSLRTTEVQAFNDSLQDAYRQLSRSARANGRFVQPVLARCVVRDKRGRRVFETPPVLISPAGLQCLSAFEAEVPQSSTRIPSLPMAAESYRLGLVMESALPQEWASLAHTLDVQVSVQMHPLNPTQRPVVNVRRADGNVMVLSAHIPGALDAESLAADRIAALIDHPSAWRRMARYTLDDLADCADNVVAAGPPDDILTEISVLRAVVEEAKQSADSSLARECSIPHSFAAQGCASNGALTLWHGITPLRFSGYPLGAFAVATDSADWQAAVKVAFAGGEEQVVWSGQGRGRAPLRLGPVLSYPSAQAVSMTIYLVRQRCAPVRMAVPLTATPGGGQAVYIHPSLQAWTPEGEASSIVVPSTVVEEHTHRAAIMAASAVDPCAPLVGGTLSAAAVVAAAAGRSAATAWNFATPVFYLFTSEGINVLSINKSTTAYTLRRIDGRCVDSPGAVVETDLGVYAIASGDLVRVDRQTVTTCASAVGAHRLAWVAARRELWLINGYAGRIPALVVTPDDRSWTYRRDNSTCGAVAQVVHGVEHVYALSSQRLVDLSCEDTAPVNVSWRLAFNTSRHRPRTLTWPLYADNISGCIAVSASRGAQPYAVVQSAYVNGRLLSAPHIPLFLRRAHMLTLTLDANVSHFARLAAPHLS